MKELNLTVYTSGGEAKVTMTATFETHDQAVAFHDGVARLCREHSVSKGQEREWWARPRKLLGVAIVMTADQELALAAAEADTKRKNPGTLSGALWGVVRKTQC